MREIEKKESPWGQFYLEKRAELFQKPENVQHVEEPKAGYFPDAGLTIIAAGKK
jgi:hypothetical protein